MSNNEEESVVSEIDTTYSKSVAEYLEKKELEELKNKKSPDGSTCLITLYIPPNRALSDFVSELTNEVGTAANIRSKTTRKNVISALQVIIGRLKKMGHRAPENGLAIFAGVTEDSGNKVETHIIVPPTQPIGRKLYVCDNKFHVDHLESILQPKETYVLLVLDGSQATIATLTGTHLEIIKSMKSGVGKKHRAGGQSSVRFARLREEALQRFLKRVASTLKDLFIEQNRPFKGLVIGGPGPTKNMLEQYLDYRLKNKLLAVVDIGYGADKQGIMELLNAAQDVLKDSRLIEEKRLVQRWLNHLYENKATYGEQEVRKYLEMGAVDTVLLIEDLKLVRVKIRCETCGETFERTVDEEKLNDFVSYAKKHPCPYCKSPNLIELSRKTIYEDFSDLAKLYGSRVEVISLSTEEGAQLKTFGGIAAILRYSPEDL